MQPQKPNQINNGTPTRNAQYRSAGGEKVAYHYPTDRNLLWDAARVMVRIAAALADEWNLSGWRQAKHHAVTLQRLYQRVANTRRPEAWREDIDAFLAKCDELLAKAEATRADLLERGAWPEELEDLDRRIRGARSTRRTGGSCRGR